DNVKEETKDLDIGDLQVAQKSCNGENHTSCGKVFVKNLIPQNGKQVILLLLITKISMQESVKTILEEKFALNSIG
ncbi:hypothetical protein SEEH1565_19728, partial [Salmonella enterica subsp. enterica serovar Heidelberg str. 41565]